MCMCIHVYPGGLTMIWFLLSPSGAILGVIVGGVLGIIMGIIPLLLSLIPLFFNQFFG